jgi:hypothetical protein
LATGAGAESRRQIGWVIVGGMSLGTLLTIFVVPTIYTLFARRRVPGEIRVPDDEPRAPTPGAPVGAGAHAATADGHGSPAAALVVPAAATVAVAGAAGD